MLKKRRIISSIMLALFMSSVIISPAFAEDAMSTSGMELYNSELLLEGGEDTVKLEAQSEEDSYMESEVGKTDPVTNDITSSDVTKQNPDSDKVVDYADDVVLSEENTEQTEEESISNSANMNQVSDVTQTWTDAVQEMREFLKARTTGTLTVNFVSDNELDCSTLYTDFKNAIFEHTGVPTEGDYLRWQIGNWVISGKVTADNNKYYYTMSLQMDDASYYDNAEQEREADSKFQQVANELDLYSDALTDYEKACRIYLYATENISYGGSTNTQYTGYGALVEGMSVCQGFTVTIYRLALMAGLDARIVMNQEINHAWNLIKVGSYYYNCDATWDAGHKNLRFFLCGDESNPDADGDQTYMTFSDLHISDSGYYRPDWVNQYNVSKSYYPCFESVKSQYYPAEIIPRTSADGFTCTAGSTGYCEKCGQFIGHEHVYDQKIENDRYIATEGNCKECTQYYMSCACGAAGTEIFAGSVYGAHKDKDFDDVCDICGTDIPHVCSPERLTFMPSVDPTCTQAGHTAFYACNCGKYYKDSECSEEISPSDFIVSGLGHDFSRSEVTKEPNDTETGVRTWYCSRCDATKTEEIPAIDEPSFTLKVETGTYMKAYADGTEIEVGEDGIIELPSDSIQAITTIEYSSDDDATNYPVKESMKVYFISKDSNGELTATRDKSFDGILQYLGTSIRTSGKQGIRIITGAPKTAVTALRGKGLNGWKLVRWGMLAANDTVQTSTVIIGSPKSATADFNSNPFADYGKTDGYTVGITFDNLDQCKTVFSIRPYMVISNGSTQITLYGGIVHRSIGAVAYQLRNAYDPKKEPTNYNFVWNIIRYCGLA